MSRIYPSRSKEVLFDLLSKDTDECQEWPMSVNGSGAPQMSWEGKSRLVTHIVWELEGRTYPRPPTMRAHSCGNRICVNPKHLILANKQSTNPGTRLTDEEIDIIWQMHSEDYTKNHIATYLGRSWQSVHYVLTGKRRAEG
jgi:hypothetical protein